MKPTATAELTFGVEEEFFLVDRAGLLVQEGPESLATADADADVKPEMMRCQVESATKVCTTSAELFDELAGLRGQLADGAAARDALLIASGTVVHPQAGRPVVGPGSRYRRIAQHVGELVAGAMSCGCHVHVGVGDRETAIRVSNHLRPWLPVLLAMSANSPFTEGRDTGYASARHVHWNRWPSAGPPPYLESEEHYESIVRGLLDYEVVMDRGMIYWDIRPSEHQPTVEIRIADVAGTVEEATAFAVLVRGLVAWALDRIERVVPADRVPHELVGGGLWRAARDGFDGACPDPDRGTLRPAREILTDLADRLDLPAEDAELLRDTVGRVAAVGDGASRQRAAFARRGRLGDVVELLAEQTVRDRLPA